MAANLKSSTHERSSRILSTNWMPSFPRGSFMPLSEVPSSPREAPASSSGLSVSSAIIVLNTISPISSIISSRTFRSIRIAHRSSGSKPIPSSIQSTSGTRPRKPLPRTLPVRLTNNQWSPPCPLETQRQWRLRSAMHSIVLPAANSRKRLATTVCGDTCVQAAKLLATLLTPAPNRQSLHRHYDSPPGTVNHDAAWPPSRLLLRLLLRISLLLHRLMPLALPLAAPLPSFILASLMPFLMSLTSSLTFQTSSHLASLAPSLLAFPMPSIPLASLVPFPT